MASVPVAARLTPNGIAAVDAGDLNLKPVVQVVDVRPVSLAGERALQERYRAVLSDGLASQEALFATQLNDILKGGRLRVGSIVQLLEYIPSSVRGRRIIMVLNMEILSPECEIIGNVRVQPEAATNSEKLLPVGNLMDFSKQHVNEISTSEATKKDARNSTGKSSSMAQVFQPLVQPCYKPPPAYKNHGAIMKNEAPARVVPIAALNPYQGRWAIKARVTAKGDIHRYNNARGDGKVFSFDLLDSDGGEIRVKCFNAVADKFYDIIEEGKVYIVSKGSLKPAKKDFNHLNSDWEIFLEAASTVEACYEENCFIPTQRFDFKTINEVDEAESNSILDIIGVVTSVSPATTVLRKNGLETQRRSLNLKDVSGQTVEITLWGGFCSREGQKLKDLIDSGTFPVLAVKAGKVNEFSGKSVGTISSTQLFIDPDLPEAHRLRDWFDGGGKDAASHSISREAMPCPSLSEVRKTISQIKDEGLGLKDKADWIVVKATVSFIKADSFCYTACPLMIGERQCGKKVTKTSTEKWCCNRCNMEFDECDYRYLLQVQIQDHTGPTWVTAFQESAEQMLLCSAKDLFRCKYEEHNDEAFAAVMCHSLFKKFFFTLKIKEELYGDQRQVKITVVKVDKVDPSVESRQLLAMISKLSA